MRTLLVTGASSEMGQALILDQAARFDCILAHCNSAPNRLEHLRQSLGERIHVICADFSSEDSTRKMVEEIGSMEEPPTDIVHLPAGPFYLKNFPKIPWSMYETHLHISVRSLVLILQELLPKMAKANGGRVIVMLSSVTEGIPPKYLAPYVTAKYALLGFMRELSVEYASKGISINGISPEMMDTKYVAQLPDVVKKMNQEKGPRKRMLRTEDVLPVFRMLLQEDAKAITGQNFVISDGK